MKYPEINIITKQYWSDEDFLRLTNANSIKEVFLVASDIISRMPENIGQVCGPISSGGKGSIEENLKELNAVIGKLQEDGLHIFDQMPFEETIHRIVNNTEYNQKYEDILSDFYEPLFMSGRITTLYFIPGWESSRGANWEHNKAEELGISIVIL